MKQATKKGINFIMAENVNYDPIIIYIIYILNIIE